MIIASCPRCPPLPFGGVARCLSTLGVRGSLPELCVNAAVTRAVLLELQAVGRKAKLQAFEQVF